MRAVSTMLVLCVACGSTGDARRDAGARHDASAHRPAVPSRPPAIPPQASKTATPTEDAAPSADAGRDAPDAGAPALAPIPPENRNGAARPSAASAEAWAPRLFAAIQADDPSHVLDLYFPAPLFDRVKAIADPGGYHRRLLRWYQEDVHLEHARYPDVAELQFERFQMGRCTWQEAWSEGNRIPYWACRHAFIHAKAGSHRRSYEIHVMIHWGADWYVTHLGAIRRF